MLFFKQLPSGIQYGQRWLQNSYKLLQRNNVFCRCLVLISHVLISHGQNPARLNLYHSNPNKYTLGNSRELLSQNFIFLCSGHSSGLCCLLSPPSPFKCTPFFLGNCHLSYSSPSHYLTLLDIFHNRCNQMELQQLI